MERKLYLWVKILIILCIGVSFVFMVKHFGATQHANLPLSVVIDDKKAELSPKPVIVDERAMVPVRAFGDYIGANVVWDSLSDTISVSKGDKEIVVTEGRRVAKINGEEKILSTAPIQISGTVYAPVTAFSETFGYDVEFDHATKTVSIETR